MRKLENQNNVNKLLKSVTERQKVRENVKTITNRPLAVFMCFKFSLVFVLGQSLCLPSLY